MKKAVILMAALALILCCLTGCGGAKAATMQLVRTEGEVAVTDSKGESIHLQERLGLYSGYLLTTQGQSYAWVELDKSRLTKMDENSEVSIQQEGKALKLSLSSGNLFFNVAEPLAGDETLEIAVGNMVVGIRGTCGWILYNPQGVTVCLAEGSLDCRAAGGNEVLLQAGEKAQLPAGSSEILVSPLTEQDLPPFVLGEADQLLTELFGQLPDGNPGAGSMAPQLPPVPQDGLERRVIEVTSGEELTRLAESGGLSNTEVHLQDGDYLVGMLYIENVKNFSLIGTGKTRIISNWGDDTIISIYNSRNILLYGIVAGHDLPDDVGGCSTGVISCGGTEQLKLVGCDLYGCGTVGIYGYSSNADLQSCIIRDCSDYGAMWFGGSVQFTNCSFSGNSYRCTTNPLFLLGSNASCRAEGCVFNGNLSSKKFELSDSTSAYNESGTTAEAGNGWQ